MRSTKLFSAGKNMHICYLKDSNPANIYLFKVKIRSIKKMSEICSKLTIKTTERRHSTLSVVFIINFDHFSPLFPVFISLTLSINLFAEDLHWAHITCSHHFNVFTWAVCFGAVWDKFFKKTKMEILTPVILLFFH